MFFIDLTGASFYECLISRNGLFAIWKQYLPFPLSRTKLNEKKGERLGESSKLKEHSFWWKFWMFNQKTWSSGWLVHFVNKTISGFNATAFVEIWENLNVIKGSSMMVSMTVASLAEDLTVTYFGFCAGSLFCIYHFLFWSLFVLITFCFDHLLYLITVLGVKISPMTLQFGLHPPPWHHSIWHRGHWCHSIWKILHINIDIDIVSWTVFFSC